MIIKNQDRAYETRPQMRGGEGAAQVALVDEVQSQAAKCRLLGTITLEPGSSIGHHVHEGECEMFYILRGEALVSDDDAQHRLSPGDTLITPSGHGHSIACAGGETLEFVAVIVLE